MGHLSLSVDKAFGIIPKYLVPLWDKTDHLKRQKLIEISGV